MRLVAERTGKTGNAARAALEIRLAEGFKTYWRNAGDSGVPPVFDFVGSKGVTIGEVEFPFPGVFDDGAGGKALGYTKHVALPFPITPQQDGFSIALKLDFAVCGKMCIPLTGELSLDSTKAGRVSNEDQQRILADMRNVPEKLVSASPAAVLRLSPPETPRFEVRFAYRGDVSTLQAFPEGQGFLEATEIRAEGDGQVVITISGQPAPGSDGKFGPVRLTYGRAGASFERMIDLDGAPTKP